MLPPRIPQKSEYRRKRRNIISNEQKKKRRLSTNRRDEVNSYLVSILVYGSHEDLGQHKGISFLLAPKKTTVDLTATSNSELIPVDINDEKYQNYQPSNTDDKKMMKKNIQLSLINNHLVLQRKLRQIYLNILIQYL